MDNLPKTYGSWASPISADALLSGANLVGDAKPQHKAVYWTESRATEGGRTAIMCARDGATSELTPKDANVRTTVHEYGGGSWQVQNNVVYYVEHKDQRLYSINAEGKLKVLSPEPDIKHGLRFADFVVSHDGAWLIAVHEDHSKQHSEPRNSLVAVASDGSQKMITLVDGCDFYASPRLSPDNSRLVWIQWQHPNMPWDNTELCSAQINFGSESPVLVGKDVIAGGDNESILQPEFSPSGELHYLSDRSDFWLVYREGNTQPILDIEGEIGTPPWVFGQSRYAFTKDGTLIFAVTKDGLDHMQGYPQYSAFRSLRTCGDDICFVASSWQQEAVVICNGRVVNKPRDLGKTLNIGSEYLQAAEALKFDTTDGDQAYALYFAPCRPQYSEPQSEKPPLIVLAHGGPTSCARSELNLARQFWTSRGFAVADVNYRGSSGFGRKFRQRLNRKWGIYDVADCVNAARFLVARGDVDPDRLIIRGSSAGGFTVLSALAFHDVFTAGANLYGVADLEALAKDTHKFESRYLDNLVGPFPAEKDLYLARSPIHHLSGFDSPMIVLQGSEDTVVPPNQSRMIVDALQNRKVPVAYIEFDGEQHGFRRAESIKTALNSELGFYGQVFGFVTDNDRVKVKISNF